MDPEIEELFSRSRAQQEDIILLRKQILDACAKEQELLNEKHVLERKALDLHMALSGKQNDAISDSMKELTNRKSYVEDNLRLTEELKVMEEENYMFTSSLLKLLVEYGVRPASLDALSISNVAKRIYHQLHWQLRSSHVPDAYSYQNNQHGNDMHMELAAGQAGLYRQNGRDPMQPKLAPNVDMHYQINNDRNRDNFLGAPRDAEGLFRFQAYVDGVNNTTDPKTGIDSQIPPSLSNQMYDSEGEDLPGIESFQIIGDARPGGTLTACGFPVNGMTLCIFQWIRHLQDGTRHYIEGATNPDYVVTADDVDKLIAVECIPMDEGGRQGELVRQFANNQNAIACDRDMQHKIETYVSVGKATFTVLLLMDSSDVWEQTTLVVSRSYYQIRVNHNSMILVEEKYSDDLSIKIPCGFSTQFVLISSNGTSYPFNTSGASNPPSSENDVRLRDLIALAIRIFQSKSLDDKKKGKA